MKRDRTLCAAGPGSVGAMNGWRYIGLHSAAAATFIFLLQRYGMSASLEFELVMGRELWRMRRGPRLHAIQSVTPRKL